MKKFLILSAIFLYLFNDSFSQNYSWITPNKTYLKMYVSDDGIYRINKNDFTSAGINTNTIDPRTIKVYNKGLQIPVFFNGQQDGTFDVNDYFDFYGSRNYGGITKSYEAVNTVAYSTNEYFNQYTDTNIYWAEWGGINGIRMSSYVASDNSPDLYFNDVLHFEKDKYYTQGEYLNANDLRFLTTEKFRGEGWYWSTVGNNQTISDTFSVPLLSTIPQTATIRVFAYPTNKDASIFNEHTLQINVNGNLITTLYSNDMNKFDTTVSFSSSLLSNSTVNTVSIKYVSVSPYVGSVHFDLFEVQYPKLFKFGNDKLSAKLSGTDTTSKQFRISAYNSSNPVSIYDVNNNIVISSYTSNLDTLKFTGKNNSKLEIVNNLITKKPFRIKQKQVPDLVSSSNGADYLIVYHNLFSSQAEQLRAYRQSHDNFRSFKAEIEDIYDIFNYGLEDPAAVRNFVAHIYGNWQLPKLGYICLMGRASLDPKKNMSTSVYYQNLIPTYGYPPSDGYFANVNIGTFCYYNQIAIGRLPAYYASEAQTMVDKIIAYENEPPAEWYKDFVYITGGGTLSEQGQHQNWSNFEIDTYIKPPSVSADPHKIYRNDTSGGTTFNMKDSVKNDISRGSMFVNYRGHAGSHDWEVAMSDPNTLTNGNKLPLVMSLTCFTGENSKSDFRGFGEKFVYLNNKGAIGFVSTTGWSYSTFGNNFGTYIIDNFKRDTVRRQGNLVKFASTKMSQDSLSFSIRHTLNCYTLLGDPAVTLRLPIRPDFSITSSDYALSNNFPNVGEDVAVKIFPKNYGLNADSCKIRFQLKKNNHNYSFKDSTIKMFGLLDSLIYSFKIDSLGIYDLDVTLDFGNWYPLENKSNNTVTINIPVKNTSFVPLRPVANSVISSDSVEFVALNPRVKSAGNTIKVLLQLDTTKNFNSSVLKSFGNNNVSGVSTKFKTSIQNPVNNKLYYWRTNAVINNDSTGWSAVQIFVYNNTFLSSGFNIKKTETDEPVNANTTFYKLNGNQYSSSDFNNTVHKANGIELADYSGSLYIRSYGSNAEESSYFTVGNKNIFIDGGTNTGLNLLKVKKLSGSILQFKNLKMTTNAPSSDSLISFLNTFDSTHYLMLLNAAYVVGGKALTNAARVKLRQFGSIYCDSIGNLGYFHSWSLIGYLGANHSDVSESFDPCCRPALPTCFACDHWSQSISSKDVTFKKTSGSVSSVVGPAQSWSNFSWTQTLVPNSALLFDVYGIDVNNQQTLLFPNLQSNQSNDLSSVNAYQYPKLNFVAKINIDTNSGIMSSVLNSVKVNYVSPSELVWDINSLSMSSSYMSGQELKFQFDNYNSGYSNLPGVIVNVYKASATPSNLIFTDTSSIALNSDSMKFYNKKFALPNLKQQTKILFDIKPKGLNNEFFTYNNNFEIIINYIRPTDAPFVQIYSDGQLINSGDYVRINPEIKIDVSNPSGSSSFISDTTNVSLKLNDNYIPYFINGGFNPALRILDKDNSQPGKNGSLYFYPELIKGPNRLTVVYRIDNDNVDTASFDVVVSDELLVKDLYNYPNPMKSETNFIFNLAGSATPQKFIIKIYTVSGKLIKELDYPVNIGFNQIPWDGKDSDGDFVANGTYLYKLVTEDDAESETQIQKLVVLR